jgi:K+-sensing histidine kinase KdpD
MLLHPMLSCVAPKQERHISSLFSQAQQLSQQLVSAQASASTAQAAAAAARQQAATLALQLEAASAEAAALRRAAAAATQEAAGIAHWCLNSSSAAAGGGSGGSSSSSAESAHGSNGSVAAGGQESVGEALRRRDEGLIKWFEGRAAGLLKQGQTGQQQQQQQVVEGDSSSSDTQLMALVREVCADWAQCCFLGGLRSEAAVFADPAAHALSATGLPHGMRGAYTSGLHTCLLSAVVAAA